MTGDGMDCISNPLKPSDCALLKAATKVMLSYFVGMIHGMRTGGYNARFFGNDLHAGHFVSHSMKTSK
jgi:hypothetical protein